MCTETGPRNLRHTLSPRPPLPPRTLLLQPSVARLFHRDLGQEGLGVVWTLYPARGEGGL